MLTSDCFRTRVANPDKRTGIPYMELILSVAWGLDLWPHARPVEQTEPSAFLCDLTLFRLLGRLPSVDQRTPRCSAKSGYGVVFESILIADEDFKYCERFS